jgi:hypothetical protein
MTSAAELLQLRPDVWRAGRTRATTPVEATDHAALDAVLPGGGWPQQALTEVCAPATGLGEVAMLAPALARLSKTREIAVVAPPCPVYAPGWAAAGVDLGKLLVIEARGPEQRLWAAEQSLRSGVCAAVLVWLAQADATALRRLQLAAEAGRSWAVAFRPLQAVAQSSPAALRVEVVPGRRVFLHKCRGASFLPRTPVALAAAGSRHAAPRAVVAAAFPRRAG